MSRKREYRTIQATGWSKSGDVSLLARADGYAMVRRKGAVPFVIDAKMWDDAPVASPTPSTQTEGRDNG